MHMDCINEFEDIYKRNFARLCNSVYLLTRDKDSSKDIVQTVFFRLWKKKEMFLHARSPEAYLYEAVINESLNFIKRNKNRRVSSETIVMHDTSYDPEQKMVFQEVKHSLSKLIHSLPPRCREVFLLSRNEGLSYLQISEKLNISVNTVEKHIVKALKTLKNASFVNIVIFLKYFSDEWR